MSLTQRIAHNTSFHLVGKGASIFLSLVTFGLIARYLGQAGFGQFTTVMAFLQAFAIFADMGLYMIFVQLLSLPGANQEKIVSNFITLRLISSIILLSLAPLLVLAIPQYPNIVKIGIALAALSFLFGSLIQLLTGFFQTKLDIKKVVYAEIIGRIILIGLVGLAIWLGFGLLAILGAVVLGGLVNFIILYSFTRQLVKISFRFDWPFWLSILKKTWPVGCSIILTTIYFKGDTIILSLFKSQETVGIYGAAYRILEALIMFPPIFMGLILPYLSRSWAEKNLIVFKRVFQKSFDFFIIIILPLIIGTIFLAKPLMILVAGSEFAISAIPLKILIFATGLIFMGALASYTVIALGRQRKMLWFYLLSAVVAVAGYLIFIPRYSYYGAAYMTIVAELLVTGFAFLVIWRTIKFFPSLNILWRALLASLMMGFVLSVLSGYNLFLLVCLAIVVYFICLYLFKGISRQMIGDILSIKRQEDK